MNPHERRRYEFGPRDQHAILIDDVVVLIDREGVRINAPAGKSVRECDESIGESQYDLLAIAMATRGPYLVDGVPGYVADLADAAQIAELNHRPDRPIMVRDKYAREVYRSRG